MRFVALTLAAALTLAPRSAIAQDPAPPPPQAPQVTQTIDTRPLRVDYNAPDPNRNVLNFVRAGANVLFTNYVAFQFNWLGHEDWSYVSYDSLGENLKTGFRWDGDKLPTNFFEHPYHGSLYFNSARGAGLSFAESVPYAFMGSLSWELFGETQSPAPNDLISTTMSGIVLGEAAFRLSSELLDDSKSGVNRLLREIGAASLSPMRGFNRLYMGTAWQDGPPPDRRNVTNAELHLGIDRFRATEKVYHPSILAAVAIGYGDLIPTTRDETIGPFEHFELYGAVNFADRQLSGAQVYAQGILYGWSADMTADTERERDNNIIAIVQSYDFISSSVGQFGGMSLGPGDYLIFRTAPHKSFRFAIDTDWTFLAGVSSEYATKGRDYNFSMGAALGTSLSWKLGRYGTIGWRSKHYVTAVIDGERGEEIVGYIRGWYNLDIWDPIGVGFSPSLIHRSSAYDNGQRITGNVLETQLYLRIHD